MTLPPPPVAAHTLLSHAVSKALIGFAYYLVLGLLELIKFAQSGNAGLPTWTLTLLGVLGVPLALLGDFVLHGLLTGDWTIKTP